MNPMIPLLACSGPGAAASIARNISIGYAAAGLTALLVIQMILLSWRYGLPRMPVLLSAVLFLLHPAWTVSAVKGDCGYMKRHVSYGVFAVVVVLNIAMRVRMQRDDSHRDERLGG